MTMVEDSLLPTCGQNSRKEPNSRHANPCFWSTCADDVGFVKAIVATVAEKACVDRSRIFGYGESNGGMLLYRPEMAALDRGTNSGEHGDIGI